MSSAAAPALSPAVETAAVLDREFRVLDLSARLTLVRRLIPGRIVFTTSFGLEDQVITHAIAKGGLEIELVTLDTGRLFPETYRLWADTEAQYARRIRAIYPESDALEALVADQGIDGFYFGPDMRHACCGVRKIEPLARALAGADAWITGLRSDQSAHRSALPFAAVDPARGLVKANPIFDWSRERALAFVATEGVPINPLHAQGFLSIGCAPCTRAVNPGEPERAGRWWWEDEARKECGLHLDEPVA